MTDLPNRWIVGGALAVLLLLWLAIPHTAVFVVLLALLVMAVVVGSLAAAATSRSLEHPRHEDPLRRRERAARRGVRRAAR